MDYSLLTEQQLQKRYYFLSQKIRGVLDSENNLKIIHQICRAHQLNDDEKILIVEQLVGLILLGFVSADDLSREISENIHLNHRHSDDVASEIDRKIFTSIRSEIEKVYSPPSAEVEADLRGLEFVEADKRGIEIEKPTVIEIRKPEPPIKIIGMEEEKKEIQFQEVQPPKINGQYGEVEPPKVETEPLIIHEETEFKPLSESKKSLKSLGGLFGFLSASRRKKEKPGEVKPVKVEIEGSGFFKEIIEELKPIETKIKVVDYTEVPEVLTNNQQPTTDNLQYTESPIKNIEEEKQIEEIRRVASESEPPIRIIDDLQPVTDNLQHEEKPIEGSEIEEVKPLEEIQPKKKFLSGLTQFFRRGKEDKKNTEPLQEELPIKIIDEENHRITNQNEYTNKIEGIEKIELVEKIEKPKDEVMTTTMTGEKKEELPFDGQVIITQEIEQKPKKKFFNKLSGLFRKSPNNESKRIYESKSKDEKHADTKKE